MTKQGSWPTELASRLAGRGPMPFRDYMAESLYTDELGYYTRRDLRRRGDRPTSRPEFVVELVEPVREAFVGFAEEHEPRLVDHGPGSGLLVRLLLSSLPAGLRERVDVTFIEPRLARRSRLLVLLQEFGVDGRVVSAVRDVDPGPAFVVARELLGSFPVHWLQQTEEGWREVHVDVPAEAWEPTERLEAAPPHLVRILEEHADAVPVGHRYEVNTRLRRWLAGMARLGEPGLVCVIDRPVGSPPGPEGSILALREGEQVGVYEAPGLTDISAGVDLQALGSMAAEQGLEDVTGSSPAGMVDADPLTSVVLET